jgi:hypothetical protein
MNDAEQLEWLIEAFEKGKAHVKEVRSKMPYNKKPVARAKAKSKTTSSRRPTVKMPTRRRTTIQEEPEPKRRGRPAAQKPTRKPTTTRKPSTRKTTDNGGRRLLGKLNFSKTDGWNPREGSIVADIFDALKMHKGDREKAYDQLLKWTQGSLSDWVPLKKPNGVKRTKKEQETMLRYRIARTLWDFAIQTGQHVKSENRAEYGSGNGNAKPATRRGRKPAASKPTAVRRGRPPKATAKASTRKPTTTTRGRRSASRSRSRR